MQQEVSDRTGDKSGNGSHNVS